MMDKNKIGTGGKITGLPEPMKIEAKLEDKDHKIPKKAADNADLKELVEKCLEWSEIIYKQNKKIKRRLTIMAVGDYLRLAFIIVPLILAIIYLPPLLNDVISQYSELLGGIGSVPNIGSMLGEGFNFSDIISNMFQK